MFKHQLESALLVVDEEAVSLCAAPICDRNENGFVCDPLECIEDFWLCNLSIVVDLCENK
jgi:hypothetical protein